MKSHIVFFILGAIILIILTMINIKEDIYPTYSLFYALAGIMFGAGINQYFTDKN